MVPLFEKKDLPRVRVLRFSPRRPDSVSDRAAYWLLTTSWARFLTVIAAFYLTASLLFAELLLRTGGVDGQAGSLPDALLTSLQALTVFGCGRLAPVTLWAKGALVCAVFVGWLALLLVLALVMVRFISLRPFWRPGGSLQLAEDAAEMAVKTQERVTCEQEVRTIRRKVPN